VPEESTKSKKIANARKRHQIEDEKQTAAKKRQKRKTAHDPHAFEICENVQAAQVASHNECETSKYESDINEEVVVSIIETSDKVTSTVEHPHENDVV